jgi:hypothetical protein
MKSLLGAMVVTLGAGMVTVAACGGNNDNNNARSADDQHKAMNELTPKEQKEATERAAKERDQELAAARDQPTTASGAPSANRTSTALAVSSIATARCDRELKCKNVGPNQKYLSTDECVTKMQNDKRTALNPQECPQGVSDKELASCLRAIRGEDCGNPLDSVSRLTECRSGAMCMK